MSCAVGDWRTVSLSGVRLYAGGAWSPLGILPIGLGSIPNTSADWRAVFLQDSMRFRRQQCCLFLFSCVAVTMCMLFFDYPELYLFTHLCLQELCEFVPSVALEGAAGDSADFQDCYCPL